MNLERTKPETLAAGVMDYMPSQSLAAHEYAERLNAALARLGLTERLTLPSAPATAIDELPAVVDVPLRKTLSVLMGKAEQGDASALATLEMAAQVAESIFAGLHARDFAGDRPLALPSHESLATLSQGVDALLPRKISTGWSVASLLADPTCDGIDDGVSLVRLLCSAAADSVTELKDDNEGWVMNVDGGTRLKTAFPNAKEFVINCKTTQGRMFTGNDMTLLSMPFYELQEDGHLLEGNFPGLEEITLPVVQIKSSGNWMQSIIYKNDTTKVLRLPRLKYMTNNIGVVGLDSSKLLAYQCNGIEEIYAEELEEFCSNPNGAGGIASTAPNLRKVVVGNIRIWHCQYTQPYFFDNYRSTKYDNLLHLEFKSLSCSLNLSNWTAANVISNPLFLSNFKTYIAERLSEQGSGLTLTLSQAVRDAIEGDPTIAQIITSKGWTISPAPSV